ncbi:MAG: hypothetical protein AAF624_15755 [Bacteroidota bacterium]
MDFFFENIGLLIFLVFLLLQFVGSLVGQRRTGGRPPVEESEEVALDPETGERTERPTTFEDALRQIQEALREASQPREEPEVVVSEPPALSEATPIETKGDAYSPTFQHGEDFEQQSGNNYEAPRDTLPERFHTYEPSSLPDNRASGARQPSPWSSSGRNRAPYSSASEQPGRSAADALARLRTKLRSSADVQDAYRLHVILGKPKALRRR